LIKKRVLHLVLVSIIFFSCQTDPTSVLVSSYENSRDFVEEKNDDINKWNKLDSIFNSELYDFKYNQKNYESHYKTKVDAVVSDYGELTKKFYKNYFLSKIEKLKSLVGSIDLSNDINLEKFSNILSDTANQFYKLNEKITPEDREEISKSLGVIYAKTLETTTKAFNEDLKSNLKDFGNQFKSTLENLFN